MRKTTACDLSCLLAVSLAAASAIDEDLVWKLIDKELPFIEFSAGLVGAYVSLHL